ncbi:MAG: hypothetical protein JWM57_3568 [Phycisphaerales bacterium]|nr:hypothetical protein [Phycisphaerales bacterium]
MPDVRSLKMSGSIRGGREIGRLRPHPIMAFLFYGILATPYDDAVYMACTAHFGGLARRTELPFDGFAISTGPAPMPWVGDATKGPDLEVDSTAAEMIEFSQTFPETTFVYLYAEFGGGNGEYAGFVFRAGRRIHDEPFRDQVGDYGPLERLVSHLGVDLHGNPYFEPLRRGFFERGDPMPPIRIDPAIQAAQDQRVGAITANYRQAMQPAVARAPTKKTFWARLLSGKLRRY